MRCIGCAAEIGLEDDACARCGTAAVGALFHERLPLPLGVRIPTPDVCACCLDRCADVEREQFTSEGLRTTTKISVPIAMCVGCRDIRTVMRSYGLGIAVAIAIAGIASASALPLSSSIRIGVCIASIAVGLVVGPVVASRLARFRLPGHVVGCNAVDASGGARAATLLLGNRAYAELMRALIAKRPLDDWMIELTKPLVIERVPEAERVEPARKLTEQDRKLGAQGLRERAYVSNAAPGRGRSNVADLRTGTDAAADTLRFVAKHCELGPEGVKSTNAGGAVRTLAWNEIARAFLRELPPGPPFESVWFIDLAASSGTPIRILPSTRANYGALEGTGLTSKDNFKRLLRAVMTKNPSCTVDDATRAFVESGRAPVKFEAIDDLSAFERTYE